MSHICVCTLTREMIVRLYAVERLPTIEMMVFFVKYDVVSRAMMLDLPGSEREGKGGK